MFQFRAQSYFTDERKMFWCGNTYIITPRVRVFSVYLFVEVEETFGAVNVVEGGERLDRAINGHRVKPHRSPRGNQHPVRRRTTDEHLCQQGKMTSLIQYMTGMSKDLALIGLEFWNTFFKNCPPYPWVSRDVLKISEPGNPTFHSWALLGGAALCLLIFLQLWFLFSEVNVVGHLCRVEWQC